MLVRIYRQRINKLIIHKMGGNFLHSNKFSQFHFCKGEPAHQAADLLLLLMCVPLCV